MPLVIFLNVKSVSPIWISVFIGIFSLLFAILKELVPWIKVKIQSHLISKRLGKDLYPHMYVKQEIQHYILHECQDIDPAVDEEPRNLASNRRNLFSDLKDFFNPPSKYRYLILLADSGVGKSCALLNVYVKFFRSLRRQGYRLVLFPVGIPDLDDRIKSISKEEQHRTILLLDAFDEDPKSITNYKQRLNDILELTNEFKGILISCRTQFFAKDDELPYKTDIPKYYPRAAGDPAKYFFHKIYLSPFSDIQVEKYLKNKFPFWKASRRKKARALVLKIPNLSVRPMLLAHLDTVITQNKEVRTAADIYEVLIEAWLEREEGHVDREALREFSMHLSEDLFINRTQRGSERIAREDLGAIAGKWGIPLSDWQINSRSLLNRDAEGNMKFAHRSIMEYLFVKRFLNLHPDERFKGIWTDQMKKFLLEIIQSSYGTSLLDLTGGLNNNSTQLDLQFADLRESNLRNFVLRQGQFSGATLKKSNLSGGSFIGCKFVGADLTEAVFKGADLTDADFSNAILINADLTNATLIRTKFDNASTEGAKFINNKREEDIENIKEKVIENGDLAIQIGPENTRVFVKERGIVLFEPSIAAVHIATNKVEAVGNEAKEVLGRNPGGLRMFFPIKDGVPSDLEVYDKMMQYFINKALAGNKRRGRIIICIPSDTTELERLAFKKGNYTSNASEVYLVEDTIASAFGSGLLTNDSPTILVVNISAKTTHIALIHLYEIVDSRFVRIGADEMRESIIQYIKRKYNLLIGKSVSQKILSEIGSAYPLDNSYSMEIVGRNLIEGIPKTIVCSDEEMREALADCVATILNAVRVALERTPEDFISSLTDSGILITGVGALLQKIDVRLMLDTGLPVSRAEDPENAAALGAGAMLSDYNLLQRLQHNKTDTY